MSEKFQKRAEGKFEAGERLVWKRPTISSFDVLGATEGGSFTYSSPGDDVWYAS